MSWSKKQKHCPPTAIKDPGAGIIMLLTNKMKNYISRVK